MQFGHALRNFGIGLYGTGFIGFGALFCLSVLLFAIASCMIYLK
nr:MAG TPA: protein of unknown function (DUF5516) [Caudoviricetes sp.]